MSSIVNQKHRCGLLQEPRKIVGPDGLFGTLCESLE
jgi:hypothetical protein